MNKKQARKVLERQLGPEYLDRWSSFNETAKKGLAAMLDDEGLEALEIYEGRRKETEALPEPEFKLPVPEDRPPVPEQAATSLEIHEVVPNLPPPVFVLPPRPVTPPAPRYVPPPEPDLPPPDFSGLGVYHPRPPRYARARRGGCLQLTTGNCCLWLVLLYLAVLAKACGLF